MQILVPWIVWSLSHFLSNLKKCFHQKKINTTFTILETTITTSYTTIIIVCIIKRKPQLLHINKLFILSTFTYPWTSIDKVQMCIDDTNPSVCSWISSPYPSHLTTSLIITPLILWVAPVTTYSLDIIEHHTTTISLWHLYRHHWSTLHTTIDINDNTYATISPFGIKGNTWPDMKISPPLTLRKKG